MTSTVDFAAQVEKIAEKNKVKLGALLRQSCQTMAEEVLKTTPWKTGFLKNSWWASLDGSTGQAVADPSGAAAQVKLVTVMATLELGVTFHWLNGTHYGVYLEYGTSRQTVREVEGYASFSNGGIAPRRFVGNVVDRALSIIEAEARKLANG